MKSKLFVSVAIAFIVCAFLSGCNGINYNKANEAYEKEDYNTALEIYLSLGDYKNSEEMAVDCYYHQANEAYEKEDYNAALELYLLLDDYENSKERVVDCNKHIKSDYDFLEAIEQSITSRMKKTDVAASEYSKLVEEELSYLEKFKDSDFYDSNLQNLAKKYIDALYTQKEALGLELIYEYQVKWQEGIVGRYEVLNQLYNDYDLLVDNAEFIATYPSQLEMQRNTLEAYNAIEADLSSQPIDDNWFIEDYEISNIIKNNTEYTYSTVFLISIYDENNVLIETTSAVIDNIKPDSSYKVSAYISNPDELHTFEWNNYYTDVMV